MAFRDQSVVLYDGTIKLEYKDKTHRYYKYDLRPDGSWGKSDSVKGVTTILGDTLEKKGLMTWPLGLALTELFGFYDFEPEPGNRLVGLHGKKKGTLLDKDGELLHPSKNGLLPLVQSASKAWQRRQKAGADVGSLVHSAIEAFVTEQPFELTLEKYEEGQEFASNEERKVWLTTAEGELTMARMAYERFQEWWTWQKPELLSAEQIVYSKQYDFSGAYDALLKMDGRTVLTDWKTSNASVSAGAPQGVYYSYFIQSAMYALALLEMGTVKQIDDLMIVSARKDGSFDTVMASDAGLYMEEALDWAKAVILSYRMMDRTKRALVQLGRVKA